MDAAFLNPLPPAGAVFDGVIGSGEVAGVGLTSLTLYTTDLAAFPDRLQPFRPSSAVTRFPKHLKHVIHFCWACHLNQLPSVYEQVYYDHCHCHCTVTQYAGLQTSNRSSILISQVATADVMDGESRETGWAWLSKAPLGQWWGVDGAG